MSRRSTVAVLSATLGNLPRIKGGGIILERIANRYKNDEILIEKAVFGNKMRLRTDDLIGRMLIFSQNYFDRQERRLIRKIVRKGDYVVDVGANIGVYSLILSKLVGRSGRVDAIEAEARNASELRYNVALNFVSNVVVHECGVSDKVETLRLLLNSTGNAGGHSFYDQSHLAEPITQIIDCVPISAIVSKRPRFMKLDIEGFEHRVLKAYFKDVPRNLWPDYLMVEDNPSRRENDAVALCVKAGYVVYKDLSPNIFLTLPSNVTRSRGTLAREVP